MEYYIRELREQDFDNNFPQVLSGLTTVGQVDKHSALQLYTTLMDKKDYVILVVLKNGCDRVLGCATVFFEYKFIHGLSVVGHIEDVVVEEEHRGQGLGGMLVNRLVEIAKERGCYKTILACSERNVRFYKGIGFEEKEKEMAMYHK
ncbi:Glucosamine-phosphate N-acetyltransferase [Trachipleistophora hominis]|uniref:Glucosamine 6-phosphate N-acetyltransferase n=1 Tax=Trachipleistophora hominis TaxID=72359 RepID=L7JXC8_TRAHO|nr:Glucosamine-phosphate N-acetyltransferase [Trachipleistophora hominis]